ncbi:hypothetical protein [Paractinoplanes lichenicola]|uniref:ABC transporter permease n=1 Tax=Paractinoplanes lichenicola TaxID=2802976 RepID=A0ABS1VER2_9ACTN|nr:hypothetical protein [Actinoplanes lichenicola]MBL7253172.1 hypothetical protein [Actinoplanes lichenicola]
MEIREPAAVVLLDVRRIFLIELRRTPAVWAALALLAAGAGLLYAAPQRWTAGYMILAMDQRWYLSVLLGLAMAAGATQGRRDHRSRVTELFAGIPRPRLQRATPILLAYGGAAALAYVGAIVAAALRIAGIAEYLPVLAVAGVVAAGATAMIAATWFGLAMGRLLPSAATAPALAILSIASPLAARGITGHREWLSTLLFPAYTLGGSTDFHTVPVRLSLAQLLWLGGLAAGAALLYAATTWRALVPPALGLVAAVLVLQGGSAFVKYPIDPVARELVCTADAPQVCVARMHSGVLDEVTPPARAALAKLARLPGAPTRAIEQVDTQSRVVDQPADVLLIPVAIADDGHAMYDGRLEELMLYNVGVTPFVCPDDSPGTDEAVVEAATAWLTGTPAADDLSRDLQELDEREAATRVAAVRRAILNCESGTGLLTKN